MREEGVRGKREGKLSRRGNEERRRRRRRKECRVWELSRGMNE